MVKTLKGKISLIYIGLVILIAIVGVTGFANLYKLESFVSKLMIENYKSISAATKMLEAIDRQDSAMLIYVNVDKQKGIDLFTKNTKEFMKWYNIEDSNITENGEQEIVDSISENYNIFIKQFSDLQELYNASGEKTATMFYDKKVMPQFENTKKLLRDLSILNEEAMFSSKQEATAKTKMYMDTLLVVSFLAMIVGFFVARFYAHRILYPLHRLAESISKVKEGDLNQHIEIKCNDETGKLSREFNEMTKRLQIYEKSNLGTLMSEKNKSLAIVRSISDPLLVLDTNYKIMLINKACESFFDLKEAKAIGKHYLESIRFGDIFDLVTQTVESGNEHSEKIILIEKDRDYYFNVVVTMFKDIESKTSGFIVALHNVTELKELEKVKTDFVATISHEFKTPLTSIIMAASMLSEGSMGDINDEQKETIDTLREDGERLSCLVNELLELSRIESGRAVYNFGPCSINAIVEASVNGFLDTAERKDVNLINDMEEDVPLVRADFEKIQWVMNNLISNALKYTNAGDFINIKSKYDEKYVVITVKDTGTGIPSQYLDRIFDKFVQVKGRDIEVRGTGIGLSVAKEIIVAHKGNIWVKSEIDSGSTFTFALPLSKEVD